MITASNLPVEFTPCEKVVLCTNTILGGSHLFTVGSALPLLIGAGGSAPRIWLQAISNPDNKEFISIVQDSKSTHPAVSVRTDRSSVHVQVDSQTVLNAEFNDENTAVVKEIDLRPLGLNVHGDQSGLSLGGMLLRGNTMSNVGVAFALG
jgi:hypothetical protein